MTEYVFNPPPGWPPAPPGWVPPPGWRPDPSWPPAPEGWQWWVLPAVAVPPPPDAAPPKPATTDGPVASAWPPPREEPDTPPHETPVPPALDGGGQIAGPAPALSALEQQSAQPAATAPLPAAGEPAHTVAPPPPHHPGWRERHAAKRAAHELAEAQAAWAADQAEIERSIDTVQRLLSGGGVEVSLVLKPGEQALWSGGARLIEPRRGPGHFVAGSQGVSFRIAKGVRYRVGATRGHYIPGDEVQTVVDHGTVTVTTQRTVFTGVNSTREWSFAKLLGTEVSHDHGTVLIHVSNRQKVSGVQADRAFADALGLGITVAQNGSGGMQALLMSLEQEADEHRRQRPTGEPPA